ncbi:MAG: glycogen debranching protein [Deltaproteobacteria bacterium]|nr:MAG: glycogen debranching protein [Deltaproteobacteria bacterium]
MNISDQLSQSPSPEHHLLRFRGDIETFELNLSTEMEGTAWLRTNLGHGNVIRQEIIDHVHRGIQPLSRAWFDIPMTAIDTGRFQVTLPLCEVGHFEAKCYFLETDKPMPLWPPGDNTHINIEPADTCGVNTIYNAFVRQFGPNRAGGLSGAGQEDLIQSLDADGYTVIPPSGTFRDVIGQLDFIIGRLGCRIIQLLPIHATPTTYARMGRFGSPYAALNFMSVDPALAVFDPAATPTEQFIELIDAVHTRSAKIIMDIAINHTGWAARLHDSHPEWLVRDETGRIEMPGAWGVTWEDLTRLDYTRKDLWRYMARVFLRWCRRGVDGFRCDAGYMVPEPAWKYIVARVRESFPDTIFFLEGLGGPITVTRNLLNRANLNWAYSELFQNDDRGQIENYLPLANDISQTDGVVVHFAETHDNNRLAARSKTWARLRTALCALASRHGAFGFANGVEWYADEKIDVHRSPSLNWGAADNQVDHIRRLNLILRRHPAFADRVDLALVQEGPGNHLALYRFHRESESRLLILVNLDDTKPGRGCWNTEKTGLASSRLYDLITGRMVTVDREENGHPAVDLEPGEVLCLADDPAAPGRIDPDDGRALTTHPRRIEAQCLRAKALDVIRYYRGMTDMGTPDLTDLAETLRRDPLQFCHRMHPAGEAPGVVCWQWPTDLHREVMLPPGHLLLVQGPVPFRARITRGKKVLTQEISLREANGRYFALFTHLPAPVSTARRWTLALFVHQAEKTRRVEAPLLMLAAKAPEQLDRVYPQHRTAGQRHIFLDTNGRGGMLRAPVRWGELYSRYDALLAANLNPDYPEDRWIMFTRCRVWVVFQGYSTEINGDCLDRFDYEIGRGGRWQYKIPTGQGEYIRLTIAAAMVPGKNRIELVFSRALSRAGGRKKSEPDRSGQLADGQAVYLILRPDVEDRCFHDTTKAFTGPETRFPAAVTPHSRGFDFAPAADRRLDMSVQRGTFVQEPEWQYMVHRVLEAERGLEAESDLFSPGYFTSPLHGGEHEVLTAAVSETDPVPTDFTESLIQFAGQTAGEGNLELPLWKVLADALDQFVVKRKTGQSVIAGYPWFLDWGRDSLIVTRGLIAAGRFSTARKVLIEFGRFEQDGTLPNMIHGDEASNRDTSDAPLWLLTACADLIRAEKESRFLQTDCGGRSMDQILLSIGRAMIAGTPGGVRMDPASGLIFSPIHFTWMDTNHPAGTPRQGYPVEIQALWYAALKMLARIEPAHDTWRSLADQVQESIVRYFYCEDFRYLADCLHAEPGTPAADAEPDDALRPNQLFTVTLGAVEDSTIRRDIVMACQSLIVPGAIRSLADRPVQRPIPVVHHGRVLNDPRHPYQGHYLGDEDTRRKPAYHNGTAWTWVFPSFCEAWAMAWGDSGQKTALAWLSSADRLIRQGCVGHFPEIVDGDAPHHSRGCDAQAWGVSEFLRVWLKLTGKPGK